VWVCVRVGVCGVCVCVGVCVWVCACGCVRVGVCVCIHKCDSIQQQHTGNLLWQVAGCTTFSLLFSFCECTGRVKTA